MQLKFIASLLSLQFNSILIFVQFTLLQTKILYSYLYKLNEQ